MKLYGVVGPIPWVYTFVHLWYCLSSKGVWRRAHRSGEGFRFSWLSRGLPGWADLLLAHSCALRPTNPPALPRLWHWGRHRLPQWFPGDLWQLWWCFRLCWKVNNRWFILFTIELYIPFFIAAESLEFLHWLNLLQNNQINLSALDRYCGDELPEVFISTGMLLHSFKFKSLFFLDNTSIWM